MFISCLIKVVKEMKGINIIKNVNVKKADEFNFSAILFLFFIINFINICNTINSDIIGINILTI